MGDRDTDACNCVGDIPESCTGCFHVERFYDWWPHNERSAYQQFVWDVEHKVVRIGKNSGRYYTMQEIYRVCRDAWMKDRYVE